MTHQFDTEIAKELNVNCAIIYNNLKFWCEKNKANDKNFYDGNYWTYNSVKAWKELFPYLGESQIKNALKKLEDECYIKSGEYNSNKYDRTKWYCLVELEVLANGDVENGQPIPDSKPDSKPDTNIPANELQDGCSSQNNTGKKSNDEIFETIWKQYSLMFLKKELKRNGGNKAEAKKRFKVLIKKGYSIKDIVDIVKAEHNLNYYRDLRNIFKLDSMKQFIEDRELLDDE